MPWLSITRLCATPRKGLLVLLNIPMMEVLLNLFADVDQAHSAAFIESSCSCLSWAASLQHVLTGTDQQAQH